MTMKDILISIGLIASAAAAHASAPVFEYRFPASYNGTGTAITDLSGAGNHAALLASDKELIDDRPAGFDSSLMSLTGANGGHGRTDAIDLLNNAAIAANGGFTMDIWFKWEGTYTNNRKLIDYAGTEYLRTNNSKIQFGLSNGGAILSHDIVASQWYHVLAVFDTTGNNAVADPSYPGEYTVNGNAMLYIDGVLVDSASDVVKSSAGDRLDRSISINMHPDGGEWNQGNIFNPRVYLGVVEPEPSPPSILTQPQDAFASESGAHTFTVMAGGSHPLGYQWMKDAVPLAGETATSLALWDIDMEDAGGYSVWVTNSLGSVTSTVATLTVGPVAFSVPVINEFMAVNAYIPATDPTDIHTTVDGEQVNSDWIELHNTNTVSLSLGGWYLTDDAKNPTKWRFPASATIAPGGYLMVWATRKTLDEHPGNYPFVDDEGALHTNFQLSQDGEYLALVHPDGMNVSQAFNKYPAQRGLVSYGIDSLGQMGFLQSPTPGSANGLAYLGAVADTKFNINRGFFTNAIDVAITCETPGATIRYTLDASPPTLTNGTVYTPGSPIPIDSTTTLRAAAFHTDWLATEVDTQTYLFLDDVLTQSPNGEAPPGWPSGSVNGQVFDYGMDPDIVNDATYGPQMRDAMRQIATVSLVTDFDNLVGASDGIYVNATQEGILWERPVSAELIYPDGTKGFQVNAGLRIRGAFSRGDHNPKHSFRLLFKGGYGSGKLDYPVFGDEGVDEFDNLDLRTAQNYAWSNTSSNPGHRNTLIRDVYSRDLQREMERPYTRSRYYHLYLNGQYWGIYQSQERSEASYAESYFGGHSEYYDVIKTDSYQTSFTDGSIDEWNDLWNLCEQGFETDEKYFSVQGKDANGDDDPILPVQVDVDNLIDYMTDIFFAGNQDAPITLSGTAANNFYAIRDRRPEIRQGWIFFAYDSEHSMLSATIDRTQWFSAGEQIGHFNPQWLHQKLMVHPEYQMRFGDRVQKHFFNDGVMTTSNAVALLQQRIAEMDFAIIGESARWGDQRDDRTDNPYTQADWWAEVNGFLANTFLSGRTQTVLNQLKNRALYPQVVAPSFNQHGGYVDAGFEVTISAPAGTIYYTLDGSDPRLLGGGINPSALEYDGQSAQQTLLPQGTEWSYLDDGSDPGTTWMNAGYNDTSWAAGNAELGYGDSGTEATVVGYIDTDPGTDGDQRNAATYFRKTLTLSNVSAITSLNLGLRRDDGAVVYINGQEVRRDNIDPGPVTYQSWANATVGSTAESTYYALQVDPSVLLEGDNVIAVEIHQSHATSSDISFDMELVAQVSGTPSSAILLEATTQISSRVLDGSSWSALNEAVFAVDPILESLRISELMYHPQNDTNGLPNAEYIEFQNIGTNALNLNLARLTKGVDFTFPSLVVQPGDYVIVVRDEAAFATAYPGFSGVIAGAWDVGDLLADSGEKIRLKDAIGSVVHDFKYKDSWYEITDGQGFSLTIRDPAAADLALWGQKAGWRPSAASGGSPGYDDSGQVPALGSIIINEVLAHSHATAPDWIELHNTTAGEINMGGWFLSDDNSGGTNSTKYEVPPGTTLPAGGYLVFQEDTSFGNTNGPGCHIPFGLSEGGDQVYLLSGNNGQVTGYAEEESFGASESGVAFGRYHKVSTDSYNFVAMSVNTPGAANAYPKVGPVVISQIMYNPSVQSGDTYGNDEYEYVELHNITASPVSLQFEDVLLGMDVPWRFTDGIDYTFPRGTTLPAGGSIVVARNLAAYAERHGSSTGIFGPYEGKLSNDGEKLDLSMPGDQEEGELRYYIRVDRVNYNDKAPWPVEADGMGNALDRIYDDLYGNDVANWLSSDGDADGDGIPNDWELAHGLNPLFDDASGHSDSDAFDNWFEYVTDTHPLDGNSWQIFSFEIDPGTGEPTTRFSTSSNRRYTVRYRTNLVDGVWQDLGVPFPGTGSEMTVPDPATRGQRFYRLRVELP